MDLITTQGSDEGLKRASYWLALFLILVASLAVRLVIAELDPGRVFTDTPSYLRVAADSVFDQAFWAGERPFTVPAFYKILGVTLENYQQPLVLAKAGVGQALASWFAFSSLGIIIAFTQNNTFLRLPTIVLLQVFGFSLHISQWDSLLLSESISTSMLVLWAALWILVMSDRFTRLPKWTSVLFSLLAVLISVAFAFSRDINSYFLFGVAMVGIGTVFIGWRLDWRGVRSLALSACLFVGLFALQQANINSSGRWQGPFYGTFLHRIYGYSDSRQYFFDHGMPQGGWNEGIVPEMKRTVFIKKVMERESASAFNEWMISSGRQTYYRYLASHPKILLSGPLRNYDKLIHPSSIEYRSQEATTPRWLMALTKFLYPLNNLGLVAWLVLSLVLAAISVVKGRADLRWFIPFAMLLLIPPQMLLIWHADSIEIERHAFQIGFTLRLSVWLLLILGLDAIFGLLTGWSRADS